MTPGHAEFWLVWLARGGIGLAILFILVVILGLLRLAWGVGRSVRAEGHHESAHSDYASSLRQADT